MYRGLIIVSILLFLDKLCPAEQRAAMQSRFIRPITCSYCSSLMIVITNKRNEINGTISLFCSPAVKWQTLDWFAYWTVDDQSVTDLFNVPNGCSSWWINYHGHLFFLETAFNVLVRQFPSLPPSVGTGEVIEGNGRERRGYWSPDRSAR